jgi:hypothetical protein
MDPRPFPLGRAAAAWPRRIAATAFGWTALAMAAFGQCDAAVAPKRSAQRIGQP